MITVCIDKRGIKHTFIIFIIFLAETLTELNRALMRQQFLIPYLIDERRFGVAQQRLRTFVKITYGVFGIDKKYRCVAMVKKSAVSELLFLEVFQIS